MSCLDRRRRRPDRELRPVTQQRLENPEPGNWMLYRRTYDGQGYSPLDQINTSNVKNLTPVWTFSTGVIEGHEAPPIVNNGVMFVATPMGQVIALNAKTGDEYWRYKRQLPDDLFQLHPTSRGVGLWEDKLYLATTDDHVVALDAKTGKVVWDTKVQDYKKGQYMTLMPLVVDGKVIVGGSGGEFGVRGYVAAYDAKDGKELWRTYTIPGEGEPGHDTWQGDDWKTGGGSAWMTGNYDKDTKTIYWGVGNAAPWPGEMHPGDNLYTSSVLALDPEQRQDQDLSPVPPERFLGLGRGRSADADRPATGRPHHQEPGPSRPRRDLLGARAHADQDQLRRRLAVRLHRRLERHRGRDRQADRRSRAQAGGRQAGRVLPVTVGRQGLAVGGLQPEDRPRLRSRQRELLRRVHRREGAARARPALARHQAGGHRSEVAPGADHFGELQAWDPATGKKVWQHNFPKSQLFGSVTATAGDLVFAGGTNDRNFRAFDAKTGEAVVGAEDQLRHHGHAGVL